MANQLTMAEINAILTLHKTGHSNRRIAELLASARGPARLGAGVGRPFGPVTIVSVGMVITFRQTGNP